MSALGIAESVAKTFRDACTELEQGRVDLTALLALLLELVAAALTIGEVEPTSGATTEDPPGLTNDAQAVVAHVLGLEGVLDDYWLLFDPMNDQSLVAGSLADDISDIYKDLRRGLYLADRGSLDDALWEWRSSFESHWGRHATGAIAVLERLINGQDVNE